ncbi:MAG: acyltransferase, partial [Hellea sp.]|nr:acyltransferase [Hellea sp.]
MENVSTASNTSYWHHIDGLRAFAVLVVLFFHFNTPGFANGYLGVDIFFAISGFLVTRLILKDLKVHGKMRYKRFFKRRVRRLFPALAVTCIITTIFAYAMLSPERLATYGRSVASAIISVANVNFWAESGYFDTASETKPLLHTWSLSVEEQFYLFWPVSLTIAYKYWSDRGLAILTFSAFFLSIGLIAIWKFGNFDPRSESTIFYWMPFRVYEFMLGAMALILYDLLQTGGTEKVQQRVQNILGFAGLGFMLAVVMTPASIGDVPGPILGFFACLGAVCIILSPHSWIAKTMFSWKLSRWIGRSSYSLYLVHWPIWIF